MMHKVAYKKDEKYFKPHTVRCSCQFSGEFASKEDAEAAIAQHLARHEGNPNFSSEKVGSEEAKATAPAMGGPHPAFAGQAGKLAQKA